MPEPPYRRVQVIVNPASGRDEPVLNVLNDVFRRFGVDWDISLTHRYGDAATLARKAVDDGVDLVAGYGGDGTQHEIANALMEAAVANGRQTPMGILPGGTGNGFAREMGVPSSLAEAVEVLCTSTSSRAVDVGHIRDLGQAETPDRYFVQRLYVGVEPEEQTSRELKDRYGVFAYLVNAVQHARDTTAIHYRTELDGKAIEFDAERVYVVNSGMMGTGLKITKTYAIDDGLLDCFSDRPACRHDLGRRCHPLAWSAGREGDPLPPPVPRDPDRDRARPGGVDRRRVRRPHACDGRRDPRGPGRCRPLSRDQACLRSTGRSTTSTPRSGSPTSGSWATSGSRRSSPVSGSVARRSYRRDYDAILTLGITAVLDTRAERTSELAFYDTHGITHSKFLVP